MNQEIMVVLQGPGAVREKLNRLYLGGAVAEIAAHIIPHLSGRPATLAQRANAALQAVLDNHATEAAADALEADVAALVAETDRVDPEQDRLPAGVRVVGLRETLCAAMREAVDRDDFARLDQLIKVELDHRRRQDTVSAGPALHPKRSESVDPATMTDAFRQMFPNLPSIAATEVQLLSGGNSKRILAVTLKDSGDLPSQMIVRQDVSLGADTSVASEYPVIQQFAGKGFPIPECYRLELRETAIGSNFLLMQRMPGAAISDSYDVSGVSPAIAHDIARTIARLHQFDPRDFTFLAHSNCTDAGAAFLAQLAYYRQQWRNKALIPSPIVEYAYAWLEREAQSGLGAPTIVHGDLSPFNFLADQERVTALLDWEFVHIGDPVEDIAYIKPSIEQIVPWDDFMATYVAHGGRSVDAHQIKIFSVWASVRNTALAAGVISDLVAGRTTEFGPAAMGFGAFKMLEEQAFAALFG